MARIAVIGAGPAGLMAAEQLAGAGHGVAVYDQMPSPARKLLIAGRGGLNLTHSEPLERFLTRYGNAATWLEPAIRAFPPDALRAWCESLGQPSFVGSSGRVFPRSMKAVQLLRAWLQRLEGLGVRYHARHRWLGWREGAVCFQSPGGEPLTLTPDITVLALGGASWPRLGSDGGWQAILSAAQVPLAPLRPANCGFTVGWTPHMAAFAGQPLKPVRVTHGGRSQQGEAMVTAQGIEGGAVYALSSNLRETIARDGAAVMELDLRPSMSIEALAEKLQGRANRSLSTHLRKANVSPLAIALLRECVAPHTLATADAYELAAHLKALPLVLTGTTGLARAISSAGGIRRDALDAHFMLRAKPGVFAIGEMLDWEAPTGGYLLQACFSTAVAAARGIEDYLDQKKNNGGR